MLTSRDYASYSRTHAVQDIVRVRLLALLCAAAASCRLSAASSRRLQGSWNVDSDNSCEKGSPGCLHVSYRVGGCAAAGKPVLVDFLLAENRCVNEAPHFGTATGKTFKASCNLSSGIITTLMFDARKTSNCSGDYLQKFELHSGAPCDSGTRMNASGCAVCSHREHAGRGEYANAVDTFLRGRADLILDLRARDYIGSGKTWKSRAGPSATLVGGAAQIGDEAHDQPTAISFDNERQYATIDVNTHPRDMPKVTYSIEAKLPSEIVSPNPGWLVSQYPCDEHDGGRNGPFGWCRAISLGPGVALPVPSFVRPGSKTFQFSMPPPPVDEWFHIVATWSHGQRSCVYMNGVHRQCDTHANDPTYKEYGGGKGEWPRTGGTHRIYKEFKYVCIK